LGTIITLALAACAADGAPPPLYADLVVTTGPISVNETEFDTGEGESIALENQITVGPGAKGFLTVRDLGRFELFPNAAIRIQIWEQTEAGVFLGGGHVTFTEDEESPTRLTLETSSSTIKTLKPATKFTVCQPSTGNTCVVVEEGQIELTSAGLSQTYEAGQGTFTEAAFLIKGERPGPAICVPKDELEAWFEEARLNEEFQPLGQLVGGYSECGAEPPRMLTVFVPGTVLWTDSGIEVVTGDTLEIKAGGRITHSKNGPLLTPDGDPNLAGHESNLPGVEDANHAGLIGRIGEDGVPFAVGSEVETTVESDGRLYLGINDSGVGNNDGEFVATVTLTSP
jgi:hypothetical protein